MSTRLGCRGSVRGLSRRGEYENRHQRLTISIEHEKWVLESGMGVEREISTSGRDLNVALHVAIKIGTRVIFGNSISTAIVLYAAFNVEAAFHRHIN